MTTSSTGPAPNFATASPSAMDTRLGNEITGLPHRGQLLLRVEALIDAMPSANSGLGLASIEVLRIAELSASLGFEAANTLARTMAERLETVSQDGEWGAHMGSGEFAWICTTAPGLTPEQSRAHVLARVKHLEQVLQAKVQVQGYDVFPSCQIGVAVFPGDALAANQLLQAAQSARMSLDADTSSLAIFQPHTRSQGLRQLRLETDLRHAQVAGQLSLMYQPQMCLRKGGLIGAEALLRWHHPELGLIDPEEFIPIAERSGLIVPIGRWVLEQVCSLLASMTQRGPLNLRLWVNASIQQFLLSDMVADIERILTQTGAPADGLGLELNEEAMRHGAMAVDKMLRHLNTLGVEVALDDFGKGYSCLSQLPSLPLGLIKIERGFISDVTGGEAAASVTRSIVHLAHALQIRVLAIGVETEDQLRTLSELGCDQIQGFVFSPALDAEDLLKLLSQAPSLSPALLRQEARTRTLMLVDDEENILSALKRLFRRDGYRILTAPDGPSALALLADNEVDVIVSDQRMPGMAGVDLLRQAKVIRPDTIRMTLSGFTDLQSIIDAVNEGAVYKFLTKPWDDERLREHVAHAFRQKELGDENVRLNQDMRVVNMELAQANRRLGFHLERQREQANLMHANAMGAFAMLDLLPLTLLGIDTDDQLIYTNRQASERHPHLLHMLGGPLDDDCTALVRALRAQPHPRAEGFTLPWGDTRVQAWLASTDLKFDQRGSLLIIQEAADQVRPHSVDETTLS